MISLPMSPQHRISTDAHNWRIDSAIKIDVDSTRQPWVSELFYSSLSVLVEKLERPNHRLHAAAASWDWDALRTLNAHYLRAKAEISAAARQAPGREAFGDRAILIFNWQATADRLQFIASKPRMRAGVPAWEPKLYASDLGALTKLLFDLALDAAPDATGFEEVARLISELEEMAVAQILECGAEVAP